MIKVVDYTSYMDNIIGPLGYSIPQQSLSACQEVNLTPKEVAAWCLALPVGEISTLSQKIYHVLSDCNKVALKAAERFEIMELLNPHVETIQQSLTKHFTHQTHKLTKHQLIIANLSQTLCLEMANGYKLVVEQGLSKEASQIKGKILNAALQQIIFYNTEILIQNYQIYLLPPKGTWKEIHLCYKLAEEHKLLANSPIASQYKRTLLLAAADPYQWNQSEQKTYFKASKTWAEIAVLRQDLPGDTVPGFYILDLNKDIQPTLPSRNIVKVSESSLILDLNPVINRIKELLALLEPNEFKVRLNHIQEPEFNISVSMLKGLVKEWATPPIIRSNDRVARSEAVRLCVGLISTHYYLNNQTPFKAQQAGDSDEAALQLPAFTVQEGSDAENAANPDASPLNEADTATYPLYSCTIENENATGYGILWLDDTFPPIQAGEVIALERTIDGLRNWEICKIHWLQHQNSNQFRLGIERLSRTCKAGAAQAIEEGKPVGIQLRCLLLESTLIVPILPFKVKNRVQFSQINDPTPQELDLVELIDSTGNYQQFSFKKFSKDLSALATELAEEQKNDANKPKTLAEPEQEGFESIWKNL